jgi:hypothetical protein
VLEINGGESKKDFSLKEMYGHMTKNLIDLAKIKRLLFIGISPGDFGINLK